MEFIPQLQQDVLSRLFVDAHQCLLYPVDEVDDKPRLDPEGRALSIVNGQPALAPPGLGRAVSAPVAQSCMAAQSLSELPESMLVWFGLVGGLSPNQTNKIRVHNQQDQVVNKILKRQLAYMRLRSAIRHL